MSVTINPGKQDPIADPKPNLTYSNDHMERVIQERNDYQKKINGGGKKRKPRRSRKMKVSKKNRRKPRHSRKMKVSKKNKKNLRGGSGAASAWAKSLVNCMPANAKSPNVEVPKVSTHGVKSNGPVTSQDIVTKLTKTMSQASANRVYDNNA